MDGMAERQQGYSRRLVNALRVGQTCTLSDIAGLLDRQTNALAGRGVYRNTGADCFVIFVTLDKKPDATQYRDHLFEPSCLLFWEGQTKVRMAEDGFTRGLDCHVFIHNTTKTPYRYYGRAVTLRSRINPVGTPSQFVLYLPEYDAIHHDTAAADGAADVEMEYKYGPTDRKGIQTLRTRQNEYRNNVVTLWHGRCAVTGVDETSWLIASHIKPWRESTDRERVDPRNSLLLSPNYDKLFDRGVISFRPDNGRIILPASMSHSFWKNLDALGITDESTLEFVPHGTDGYLEYHRRYIFGYSPSSRFDADELVAQMLPIA